MKQSCGIWQPTVLLESRSHLQLYIVCGLCNESIQKHLLTEVDLTLTKMLEIAQSMEVADQNAQRLKGGEPNLTVSEAPILAHYLRTN